MLVLYAQSSRLCCTCRRARRAFCNIPGVLNFAPPPHIIISHFTSGQLCNEDCTSCSQPSTAYLVSASTSCSKALLGPLTWRRKHKTSSESDLALYYTRSVGVLYTIKWSCLLKKMIVTLLCAQLSYSSLHTRHTVIGQISESA